MPSDLSTICIGENDTAANVHSAASSAVASRLRDQCASPAGMNDEVHNKRETNCNQRPTKVSPARSAAISTPSVADESINTTAGVKKVAYSQ